jgi:hypothetical protein
MNWYSEVIVNLEGNEFKLELHALETKSRLFKNKKLILFVAVVFLAEYRATQWLYEIAKFAFDHIAQYHLDIINEYRVYFAPIRGVKDSIYIFDEQGHFLRTM